MEKGTEKRGWLTGVWRGTAVSVIGYFLLLALAAYLTAVGHVGERLIGRAAWLCAAAAALMGSLLAGKGNTDARRPLLCAAEFFTFVVLAGLLLQTEFSPAGALTFASAVIAGTLASLLMLRRGRRGRKGKRRKNGRSAR